MDKSINKSCNTILNQCMNLKKNESCLIITDSKLFRIGKALYKNSLKITKKSKLIKIPIPEAHGAEPSEEVAREMLKYDVVLMPTTKSLSHTAARKNASLTGARIASMPGITEDMMKRTLNVDFNKIRKTNNFLISKLKNCSKIKITTKNGTNVTFFVKNRKWISDDGIYTKKGSFGNLPAGEIFIAPLEGKTNGIILSDANISKGNIESIRIKIKDGFIYSIQGKDMANQFKKLLKTKLYRNVAELGIGTNYKAEITGNILEDEKVMGTCHIAFGNNRHFGGKVDVPFHRDFVIKNPTIFADDELIVQYDKFKT